MKIKFGLLILIPVFLAGCGHSTRSSGSYLGEITRHPDRYMGATVSVFGTVVSVDHTDNGTRFRIATVNYAYVFDVTYPGSIPKLSHDKDAYLLGKVVGSEKSVEAYSGVIIKLSAIAVRPVGGKAVYRQQDRRIAQQWVKGKLDLSEVQTVASGQEEETEMAAAAAPAPAFAPTPRAAAPSSYPGLEGLAEPVQIAGGAQPVSSTPVHISSEPEMGPPPPPPPQAQVAYTPPPQPPPQAPVAYAPPPPPVQAPVPNAMPAPPLAPPPVAYAPPPAPPPVAYAPPPAPPPVAYAPPPAQAPVAYAPPPPPVSLDKADAADLRMINGKWNDLPEAAKAEIIRQIVANYKDLTVVSQNWRGLPDQVKAMILKQIIESGP